jgi:hypothetical protein
MNIPYARERAMSGRISPTQEKFIHEIDGSAVPGMYGEAGAASGGVLGIDVQQP